MLINAVYSDSTNIAYALWRESVYRRTVDRPPRSIGSAWHDMDAKSINVETIDRVLGLGKDGLQKVFQQDFETAIKVCYEKQMVGENEDDPDFDYCFTVDWNAGTTTLTVEVFDRLSTDAKAKAQAIVKLFEPHFAKASPDESINQIRVPQWDGSDLCFTIRDISCPAWADIRDNYSADVVPTLERLVADPDPSGHGKLVIIHGPPGCGKTYFLRAMLRGLRKKYIPWVVSDPEELSRNVKYYYGITDTRTEDEKRGHLIIIEDSADLLMSESRGIHFDKIGKMLNMTDGIVGQGRNDLFVMTFNEEIGEIDPAFRRPGRCNAVVNIGKFNADDADFWLHRKGYTGTPPNARMTLAEMYGTLKDGKLVQEASTSKKTKVGF